MVLKVTLIRHGQTNDNRNQIIQGQKDTPLNSLGIDQARLTGQYLSSLAIHFDQIWCSDLQRAHKTAELIAQELAQPVVPQTDKRLRERFLGDLEGKPRRAGADQSTAERPSAVLDRLLAFWQDRLVNGNLEGKRVLVVSHGAALRSLIFSGLVNSLGYEIDAKDMDASFANCSLTEVEISDSRKALLSVGRSDHLIGKMEATKTSADDLCSESIKPKV